MKINIQNKYLYILDKDNNQIEYFENFEEKKEKHKVIKITSENKKGDNFLKENNCVALTAEVYWFGKKQLNKKVMFVREKFGAFSYLVLI